MYKYSYLFLFLVFTPIISFAQTLKNNTINTPVKLKAKFNQRKKIGLDSTFFYMEQLTLSNQPPYKVFGFAATHYLKTKHKLPVNHTEISKNIATYLPQIKETKKNYPILFDIYNLIGNTYKRKGALKDALYNYEKAENYAIIADDILRIVKIKGNIALIYQDIGELKEALHKIQLTKKIIDNNKEDLKTNYPFRKYKVLLNTAAIYNSLYQKYGMQYYADSSASNLKHILSDKELNLNNYTYGQTNYNLAVLYTLQKDYKKAALFFNKAISLFKKTHSNAFLYKSYYNNGINSFRSKNYNTAKHNFLKALNIKKDTLLDHIYVNSYKYLSEIYLNTQKTDSALYYYNIYDKMYANALKKENEEILKLFDTTKEDSFTTKIATLKKQNAQNILIYNSIIAVLSILVIYGGYIIIRNKKEKKKAKERLQQLLSNKTENTPITEHNLTNSTVITDEQHQQIINGLLKIEKSLFFLRENFNLYNAAKKIGTNTTYLSKVIKTYKEMTFSEYTNELRINYIVKKLKEDKRTRAYTTQAIGEIGGYKNAKSFTRIFKKHTGITPYQFIEKIDTEVLL